MGQPTKYLPLVAAVVSALAAQTAMANTAQAEPTVTLDTIKVNVDRQGAKVKTNVVTLQEKNESTATTLRDVLKDEPAIDFAGGNGAAQYISIRGIGQNSIDVKVDDAYSDAQILYHQSRHMLDPSLVKIVSVQKGAGAASAGIGATNGAIVARTVEAQDLLRDGQSVGFKVGATYSSNDEHSVNAAAYAKAGNFDFLLAGNRLNQKDYKPGEGYVSPKDGGDKVRSQSLEHTSYLAKVGATFGDHRLVLSHMRQENEGERNVREEFDWFDRQNPQHRELSLTQNNIEWTGKNLGFVAEAKANAYTIKNQRASVGGEQYGNVGREGWINGYNETAVETKGANINFDSKPHEDVLLKYGVNYRHQHTIPNGKKTDAVQEQEKTDTGVYVEAIGDIGNVTLTAGLRYDHFEFKAMDGKTVKNDSLNPSVGLIWQVTPSLSFNASHNHATRSPRMYDALLSHGNRGIVSVSDNVEAEKAKNTEVGFNFNNGNLSLDGGYFWQEIDGLLTSGQVARHDGANVTYANGISNVGYAKNRGWELNGRYRYNGFTARLGVAESKPEFYSTPDAQGNLPRFTNKEYAVRVGRTWTAGLAYRFANPNLEIGANHRRVEDAIGQSAYVRQIDGARGNDVNRKIDGYNLTDIYANWKPLNNDRLNVNLSVNNVADKLYRSHTANSGLYGTGREYRVGVNFTY